MTNGPDQERSILPPPDPPFRGEINVAFADSKADFPEPLRARADRRARRALNLTAVPRVSSAQSALNRRGYGVTRRTTQVVVAGVIAILLGAAGVAVAGADRGGGDFDARLKGFEEVPAVSTVATGRFEADVDRSAQTIDYKLSYSGLETQALFAHIHLGQRSVNGGVSAFLCGGGSKPDPCPASSGTVEGTITPADVVGPNAQGIEPGAFAELVRAMDAGVTYANVHSVRWPGGEIRGQIRGDDSD